MVSNKLDEIDYRVSKGKRKVLTAKEALRWNSVILSFVLLTLKD